MKKAIKAGLIFVILCLLSPIPARGQGRTIYRITLEDDIINPVTSEYITTSIERAERDGALCLIIELDTPGGLLTSTRTIVKGIMNARVPVVVYVAPKGARAGSAGVFITLAANIAAMAPGTNIGAAHPVEIEERRSTGDSLEDILGRIFQKDAKEKKKAAKAAAAQPMEQKILNDTKAWAEAIARERGRNAAWASSAVTESVSVADAEALKLGIIDIVAADTADLVAKLDGRKVKMAEGTATIETRNATIVDIPKNFRLRWLSALAHPNIAYILMMLGFYGLLFEFTHPGIAFPGIAGAVSLILAFFGLQVLPTNYAGVALIVLAIAMFIAEIKVASYGLLTVGGVITLFLGSLILFSSPYDFMRVSIPIALAFTLATLAVASFLVFIVVRSRKRRVVTGLEGIVGERGGVKSWKDGNGKVFVHGELWDATSNETLAVGTNIEVVSVQGMTVVVKPSTQNFN
ncbi:MAG: nodulation protein NfeD [Pseudomonadota bacterium]